MNEDLMKELFLEMCVEIKPFCGKLICLYSDIEYNDSYRHISGSEYYPLLKEKMENFLKLINEDLSWCDRDIETEIWDKI